MQLEASNSCSVFHLLLDLSKSLLNDTPRPSDQLEYSFYEPIKRSWRLEDEARRLRRISLDVMLMRQWEWIPSSSRQKDPTSRCLAHTLPLYFRGHSDDAVRLAEAIAAITADSSLREVEDILQFLSLLSVPAKSRGRAVEIHTKNHHLYPHYPSHTFDQPLHLIEDATSVSMTTKLFTSLPGLGFQGYMSQVTSEDASLKGTLFGGLTHSTITNLNESLGLPDLPTDHTHLSLYPKSPPIVNATPITLATPILSSEQPHTHLSLLSEAAASMTDLTMSRGWEGWNLGLPFLYDALPPAQSHSSFILASKYGCLAGIPGPPLLPESLPRLIERESIMEGFPSYLGVDTEGTLFSASHYLHQLLVTCRSKLLLVSEPDASFLQIEQATHSVLPLTKFVLEIIQKVPELGTFELMELLYNHTSLLQGTPHYFLFLSFLSQALVNYLKLVEEWVFHGQLDSQEYFGIQRDEAALVRRDVHYWNDGYTSPNKCTPSFLSHLGLQILTCGKALNLLQLCQPKHPLCTARSPWPPSQLCYSGEQLLEVEALCQAYRSEVISSYLSLSEELHLQRLAEEEREQAILIQARREARKEGERVRELEKKKFIADMEQKNLMAQEMKHELAKRAVMRSERLEEERQADQEYMAALTKEEEARKEREGELEEQAKQELEEHYQELSQEAELRRARAEWRIARFQHSTAREALWKKEGLEWTSELEAVKDDLADGGSVPPEIRTDDSGDSDSKGDGGDGVPPGDDDGGGGGGDGVPPGDDDGGGGGGLETRTSNDGDAEDSDGGDGDVLPDVGGDLQTEKSKELFSNTELKDHALQHQGMVTTLSHAPHQDAGDPHLVTTRGCASHQDAGDPHLVTTLIHAPHQDAGDPHLVTTLSHAPHQDAGDPHLVTTRGHAPHQDAGDPHLVTTISHAPHQDAGDPHLVTTISHAPHQDAGDPHLVTTLSHAPHQDAGDPHLVTTRGHAPHQDAGDPHLVTTLSHAPHQDAGDPHLVTTLSHAPHQDAGDPHLVTTRGHAPHQDAGDPHLVTTQGHAPHQDAGDPRLVNTRGHAPHQDAGDPHLVTTQGHAPHQDAGDPRLVNTRGHAPHQDAGDPRLVNTRGHAPHQDAGHPRLVTTRGHAPISTLQLLLQDDVTPDTSGVTFRGHAPPSTIQNLLYPSVSPVQYNHTHPSSTQYDHPPPDEALEPSFKYSHDFSVLDDAPLLHDPLKEVLTDRAPDKVDLDFLSLYPLPSLLGTSIELPLTTQCSLVNRALLDYFLSHCQLHQHFLALKRYLLLEDGEFSHSLSTRLCEELGVRSDVQGLCSASFLNPILSSALEASLHHNTITSDQLSFAIKYTPSTIHSNAVKALDFLELKYKVNWPCNIVITTTCLHRYNKILQFLLEMKRSSWVLKHTFYKLKSCQVLGKSELRQLQTWRHEFQHFVTIMHSYVASQLFGVTWEEFQTALSHQVESLDEVIVAHNKFIDRAIFRCLLSKKARPVMNLIYTLLSSILMFTSQVSNLVGTASGDIYAAICRTHTKFRDTVKLLISVLSKLIARGYQPHLEELLLRLNFNYFY